MVRVSIIIPCYNHGKFIDEALDCLKKIERKEIFEVIIVNDGSTDEFTNTHLAELSKTYHVISQQNKGLAGARNTGIDAAIGDYILPLDSDNKVKPEYLYTAIQLMDADPAIQVVYSDLELFGMQTGIQKSYPFNMQRLMLDNYIDACGIFRKSMWKSIGGYDEQMREGWEDWEFWMRAAFNGAHFHYVDKPLFEYRMVEDSMARTINRDKTKANRIMTYIQEKHSDRFGPQFIDEYIADKVRLNPIGFTGKIFMKTFFPAMYDRYVAKGKFRKNL